MKRIVNSLLFRIALLFTAGFIALQAAILLAVAWPDGRPLFYRLVEPKDAREIVEAVEQAPPALRQLVARATSNGAMRVELQPSLGDAAVPEAVRPAPRLKARFDEFARELGGRTIAVQVRNGSLLSHALRGDEPPRGPIRLLVQLRSGEVLVIERVPIVLQQLTGRYYTIALVAAVILALLLATLLWQVVRPVQRLAKATQAFRNDMDAPDAPLVGAPEIRALAAAFNAMKQRIGGLVGERTRMLAAIAHDLRTYLTRLRLRVDQLPDEWQRERAVSDIEEMGLLLEDILMFARTDASDKRDAPEIDAREQLLAYVEMRKESGDEVDIEVPAEPIMCRCAPLAFRRILANLIENAIRYGKRANLVLTRDQDMVAIKICDEGPGVPPGLIDRLTLPFERLEASRSRNSGGAGLGLAIVKGLVESHRGALAFETGPNGGLCAIVRLPSALPGVVRADAVH